jgi:allantoinase
MSTSLPSTFDLVVRGNLLRGDDVSAAEVGVRDGRIVAIEPAGTRLEGERVLELAADEVLLPGLVDSHVHVNEPGRTEWEGFASATRAAAAGGVTTIIDMPLNSIPPTVTVDALEIKRRVARPQAHVDVGFWGGAVPGNTAELRPLHDEGVFGFKCFLLPSGVDEFPPLGLDEVEADLRELARFDSLLIVHAEDAREIESAPDPHGPATRTSWPPVRTRPRMWGSPRSSNGPSAPVPARTSCTYRRRTPSSRSVRRRRAACVSPSRRVRTTSP